MSLNTVFQTWDEMMDYLKTVNAPQCFRVNYLPKKDQYELWIGNQPYFSYERLLELEEQEKNEIRKEFKELQMLFRKLQQEYEGVVRENVDLMLFQDATLELVGKETFERIEHKAKE